MKSLRKRMLSLGLVFVLVLSCFTVTGAQKTQAAEKSYMQKLNLKELKGNAKYKITTGIRYSNQKITSKYYITNLKKTNAKKKGYKKLTFTFCVESTNPKISKSAIHKNVAKDSNGEYCYYYYAIVDAATGKDLEGENDLDVTCTSTDWKYKYYPKQKDNDDCWVRYVEKTKVNVTVVYPASYKDLGIVIGMCDSSKVKIGKTENKFWEGKTAFGETSYYKKAKQYAFYKKIK